MSRFAAAVSEHPVTATAVGEVAGEVLERLGGPAPDLALLFVTEAHAGALEDAAAAVRAVLSPGVLLGCAAVAVVGPGVEVEERPGVSLWAGRVGAVAPFFEGVDPPFEPVALLLVGDPFTFDAETFLADVGVPVYGGMASAARGPGGNRLVLDDRVTTSGAVGAWLGPGVRVRSLVSQGCRPIGSPYVVTRAERNVIYELGGAAPMQRLRSMADEENIEAINRGLHIGVVVDERKAEFGPGDFLVRNVLGADPDNGAVAVGDVVEVGRTVQFHVRDAASADVELRRLLAGEEAAAALLFTCNGRGRRLFGEPDHDAGLLHEALDGAPAAGFFCAGELGPIGGRNALHGFTASVALFD
ncbi:MAG TPA: FIST N-terminal domain-containing protein [Acidimicrobiales bacterium]|nr:FIST N-terminal domain-containing protein [Acidimicrobiales bacterium]